MLVGVAAIWQLDWNCGIHFQDGTLRAVKRKFWFLMDLLEDKVPHGLFPRLLRIFMAVGIPLSGLGDPRENKAEMSISFMTKPIEVTHWYLWHILIVRNKSLSPAHPERGEKLGFIFWVRGVQGFVDIFSTFSRASTASDMAIFLLAESSFLALQGPELLSPLLQPCSHCIPGQMRSHDIGLSSSPLLPPSKVISLCQAFTEHN